MKCACNLWAIYILICLCSCILIKVIDCLKLFNVYFFWDCVGFWRKLNDYGFFFFFFGFDFLNNTDW